MYLINLTYRIAFTFICFQFLPCHLSGQINTDSTKCSVSIDIKSIDKISKKTDKLSASIDTRTEKEISQLQKLESRLRNKLPKADSASLSKLETESREAYRNIKSKLSANPVGKYIPNIDSISTTLKFLKQSSSLSNSEKQIASLEKASTKYENLKKQFDKAEEAKKFLIARREYLTQQFKNLKDIRLLSKVNKQVYYYSQRVKEYKDVLKDKDKATKKLISIAKNSKLFNDFFRKHSEFSSLFNLNGEPDLNTIGNNALAGLQTRASINSIIQQQIASGGPSAASIVSQQLQDAQSRITELKDKAMALGKSSSIDEMPTGFKPNNQKTKRFLDRIELGTNFQSQKSSALFPSSSNIGLSVGYKLNDQSIIGIGASYKLGLGRNIQHIKFSNEGIGLRSFIDWKIKGSFWASGGYEMNYQEGFKKFEELRNRNAWLESGLVGISKIISTKSTAFKKTKVQLFWDFLSYNQRPVTNPLVFRIGYSFK